MYIVINKLTDLGIHDTNKSQTIAFFDSRNRIYIIV